MLFCACTPFEVNDQDTVLIIEHDLGQQSTALLPDLPVESTWQWHTLNQSGAASLLINNSFYRWEFALWPNTLINDSTTISIVPNNSTFWHSINAPYTSIANGLCPPLPIMSVQSTEYDNLMHFLQEMTEPRYNSTVTEWALHPIPVFTDSIQSGQINLSEALSNGIEVVNNCLEIDFFTETNAPNNGIRLIHRQGLQSPPMFIQGIRQDHHGHPLLMHIVVGDNYSHNNTYRWINRAMIHELAHAAGLWGHSRDRIHILWENGPIVNTLSQDEIDAINLWTALPDGTNLLWYDITY